jgi:UDP-GlcNAc3NAcA epimerase
MKIATIIGARPQFIKASAVRRAIEKSNSSLGGNDIQEIIIHTGQHYDANMSQVFFDELKIPQADYHLGIGGVSHGMMTGKMLQEIEPILTREKPEWVIVYGDTNSTLAGALAAIKLHLPVAHIEAGLRSFNRKMPEEVNRIIADNCADLLFTPTPKATQQLIKEGVSFEKICQVGDVMYDVSLFYRQQAKEKSQILSHLNLQAKEYVLATIHRQENTDDIVRLEQVFRGFIKVATQLPVVIPLHPRTKYALQKMNFYEEIKQTLVLIDPVGYLDMIQLESEAKVIFTDSGGIQKEAFFFNVPCLTLRDETEWVELIEHGFNQLIPISAEAIFEAFQHSCQRLPLTTLNLYGEGNASDKIVSCLNLRSI